MATVDLLRPLSRAPRGRRLPLARPAAVGIGIVGHSYGFLVLISSLGLYAVAWLNWAAYLLSVVLVMVIAVASSGGRLRNGTAMVIGGGVVAVDVANAVALGRAGWTEGALWSVGTSGIVIIMLALVASLRLTVVVLAAHVVALILAVGLVLGPGAQTLPRATLVALDTVAVPILGMRGAQLYRRALAAREDARDRTEATIRTTEALEETERASLEEVVWVTDRIRPALEAVAMGEELTAAQRADLKANAQRLRQELSTRPRATGLNSLLVRSRQTAVEMIGPDEIATRISGGHRALLTALLEHLVGAPAEDAGDSRARDGMVTVALTPDTGSSWVTLRTSGAATQRLRDDIGRGLLERASSGPLRRLANGGAVVEFKVRLDVGRGDPDLTRRAGESPF